MKKYFWPVVALAVGGFTIYKFFTRSAGAVGQSGTGYSSGGGTYGGGGTGTRTNYLQAPGYGTATPDNTPQMITAAVGGLKSLVDAGTGIYKLFQTNTTVPAASDPNNFDFSNVQFYGVTNDPFSWSSAGSVPAVDYTPSSPIYDSSFGNTTYYA